MELDRSTGRVDAANFIASPNFDDREDHASPEVIILHCISLPPGDYQGDAISEFFCNQLDCSSHAYFEQIKDLCVSSHFLIRRDGELIQYVSTDHRAWHAGESVCLEKPKVNDFSIGIELEGLDTDEKGFTDLQYQQLAKLISLLKMEYPEISNDHLFAHSDIAPGRKPDPGPWFRWDKLFSALSP